MVKQAFKGCILTCTTFFFFIAAVYSQTKRITSKPRDVLWEDLFLLPHIELMFFPNVNQQAKIVHYQEAQYTLESAPQVSFEFGVHKVNNLSPTVSFVYGFHFGLIGRNSSFIVPAREVGLSRDDEYPFAGPIARERDISFFSVPLQVEYRFFRPQQHNRLYFLRTGISLRLAPLNSTSNGDMDVMEVVLDGNKKPFVNLNAGGGIAFVLNNLDLLRIGLNVNYDPSYVAKGSFKLETLSSYDHGTYKVKGTCFGLQVLYTRTKIEK